MGGSIVYKVWKACFQWVEATLLMGGNKRPSLPLITRTKPFTTNI